MAVGHTKINVKGLEGMDRDVGTSMRSTSPGPIRDAFTQWAVRYRSAMRLRFDKASKGDGTWKGLEDATIWARRHGKGGRFKRGKKAYAKAKASGGGKVSILRDLGQLFTVLSPTFRRLPGQLQKQVPFGIVVGFGGPGQKKSRKGKKTKATIAEIANYHHQGKGRNPKRRLLVDPAQDLVNKMADDMVRALQKVAKANQVNPAGI